MLFLAFEIFFEELDKTGFFYQSEVYGREVPSEEKRQGTSEGTFSNMLLVSELELGSFRSEMRAFLLQARSHHTPRLQGTICFHILYSCEKALEHTQDWTRIGEGKLYKCPFGSSVLDPTDTKEEARDEFTIVCLQEGIFEELAEWPKCRKEVHLVSK